MIVLSGLTIQIGVSDFRVWFCDKGVSFLFSCFITNFHSAV